MLHNISMVDLQQDKYSKIGKYIRRMREEKKLTQEQLAEKIGVKPASLSLYESGDRSPDLNRLEDIAKALGVTLTDILSIEIPDANLDIALRSENLEEEDIKHVRDYVRALKYARRVHPKEEDR